MPFFWGRDVRVVSFQPALFKQPVSSLKSLDFAFSTPCPRVLTSQAATIELVPYLLASFGHPSRIDYGTGHETNFVVWLCCLHKLGVLVEDDVVPTVLKVFNRYLQVMHKLQTVYMLEPAGSHGVWGLDDYHCLPFLWGSAQLIDHPSISPLGIHDEKVLSEGKEDYLYLDAIHFTKSLKKGAAFAECCPMLDSISHLPSWKKVNTGMMRLYEGDVLGKMPVIQHFLFGSLLPSTWESSVPSGAMSGVHSGASSVQATPGNNVDASDVDTDASPASCRGKDNLRLS